MKLGKKNTIFKTKVYRMILTALISGRVVNSIKSDKIGSNQNYSESESKSNQIILKGIIHLTPITILQGLP